MPRKSVKRSRSKLSNQMRAKIEAAIESLMAVLDEADPDPDLEDTADDEPWLGSPPWPPGKFALDAEEDPSECEPSLGSTATSPNVSQERWAQGNHFCVDYEYEPEEPDARTKDDILKARARDKGTYSACYSEGKLAAQDAMRKLDAIKHKDRGAPTKKSDFKPYFINNVRVIGAAD